jgi:hypothetical protein
VEARTAADHNQFANLIWQIADLLRGPYLPPRYKRVMLPLTVLRRFDCVLEPTKAKVVAEYERAQGGKLSGDALDTKRVPLVPLKVAAGAFGNPQHVVDTDWQWVEPGTDRPLRSGMFVAQVVGQSMEPAIPDGSYCLFSAPVAGSRQGRTVLVQHLCTHCTRRERRGCGAGRRRVHRGAGDGGAGPVNGACSLAGGSGRRDRKGPGVAR